MHKLFRYASPVEQGKSHETALYGSPVVVVPWQLLGCEVISGVIESLYGTFCAKEK